MTIEHAPLPDVTPAMLKWFFENLGGASVNPGDGKRYPNYLLWCVVRVHVGGGGVWGVCACVRVRA